MNATWMRRVTTGAGACLLLLPAGCNMASYNAGQVALQQDLEICSRYGAVYNSPVHAECMALQMQRREVATARQNAITAHDTEVIANRGY